MLQPSLHGSLILVHFLQIEEQIKKKKRKIFSPMSSAQYSHPGCHVDRSSRGGKTFEHGVDRAFLFDRSIP